MNCPSCGGTVFKIGNKKIGYQLWCPRCGWRQEVKE